MTASGPSRLTVPAVPGMLAVAREFAASVCRSRGVDAATVDDARLAVSEAMTLLIPSSRTVTVSVDPGPSAVTVEVGGGPIGPEPATGSGQDLVLGTALIAAVAARFEMVGGDGGTTIQFSFRDPGD